MAKGCALSTGYLPRGGLPRNRVDSITESPDMTSAVERGRKASSQTNKQTSSPKGNDAHLRAIIQSEKKWKQKIFRHFKGQLVLWSVVRSG